MSADLVGNPLPPVKIAFIIDGVVQEVLHSDERLAALFLSQPTLVDVTDLYEANSEEFNLLNWNYNIDSNEFTNPTL